MRLLKALASSVLLGATLLQGSPTPYQSISRSEKHYPTQVIAGVIVPDTPLIKASLDYARAHSDDMTYNHVIRSWLFGTIILNKTNTKVDPEVHAVANILHDLGWDNTGELISTDKRFEVDGAIAARNFIEAAVKNGTGSKDWDENRLQLVWDAIALHTIPTISAYKQPIVAFTGYGIFSDFLGPDTDGTHTLTWGEFNRIKEAFPRHDVRDAVTKIICGFARTKPTTTYGK